MKTAIVHDWFAGYAGSERCVESFTNIWPEADVFCLFDFLTEEERKIVLKGKKPFTSFLHKWSSVKKNHRRFLPLFPYAIEQFDLSKYDLIISSSHAVAKGVLTNSNQLHICYCHTPIRYAWDLSHQYLKEAGLARGIKGTVAKIILHYIRIWDAGSANRVDQFIANSNYIAKRIEKVYRRDAEVIYPPVDTENFKPDTDKKDYFVTASRMVPYKKMDIIAEAFSKMPDKKLIMIGEGPELPKIKLFSANNIEFTGYLPPAELSKYLAEAKAFIFAAEEDFGISVVEALSCGTPVIAYKKGGALESITENENGIFYDEQNADSIIKAVKKFEENPGRFNTEAVSNSAKKFDRKEFEKRIKDFVDLKCREFFG